MGAGQAPLPEGPGDVRIVPARWLFALLTVVRLLLRGGKLTKFGIVGLVWAVAPRKLKVAGAALAATGAIVLVGAIAAITLLALQLV
jgi:hypothetical protein